MVAAGKEGAMTVAHDTLEAWRPPAKSADRLFMAGLAVMLGSYALLIALMIAADLAYAGGVGGSGSFTESFLSAFQSREIRSAMVLTMVSCTFSAILSVLVAVPAGYLLSRCQFRGRRLVDALLDIPLVLPPLVVGLSLLILFQFLPRPVREAVVYERPAVVLAQFAVACSFAIRVMKAAFDQIDSRCSWVARTLGCSHAQAFFRVELPEAWPGVLTAGTIAWARALGEFGPLLIFAGATRNKTEVLSTTVFLELSIGDLTAAVTVSLIMVFAAVAVVATARASGSRTMSL